MKYLITGQSVQEIRQILRRYDNFPISGIKFVDISPLFAHVDAMSILIRAMCLNYQDRGITKVFGIEARGFPIAALVAKELNVPFYMIRKEGKLPGKTLSLTAGKEYGSNEFQISFNSLSPNGDKVLIVDDVLATGQTIMALDATFKFLLVEAELFCLLNLELLQFELPNLVCGVSSPPDLIPMG